MENCIKCVFGAETNRSTLRLFQDSKKGSIRPFHAMISNSFVTLSRFVTVFSENSQNDVGALQTAAQIRAMAKVKMLNIVKDSHC